MSDTIFALATAPGRAAVAVLRVSGPRTREALKILGVDAPKPRRAAVRLLRAADGTKLDRALVLWFPGPASYTGEDCVELHLHGGTGVIDGVTAALLDAGLRLAEPGEFTRRAFENGKLDLDQAEAIGDLVDAQSAAQARQALGQLEGALGRRYEAWREALIDALAQLEAAVDFPDEALGPEVAEGARAPLENLLADLEAALGDAARGQRVREGYRVAIVGAPNAGKSSLLNALAERDAAIVTETAGATRDVIEVPLILAGYQVVVADMAGIRASDDPIELEGVRRARAWSEGADLRLWIVDRSVGDGAWAQAASLVRRGDLCLLNKLDLPEGADGGAARRWAGDLGVERLDVSVTRAPVGIGEWLERRVTRDLAGGDFPAATRARHRDLLTEGRGRLARALANLAHPELVAEDIRLALRALERITGRVGVEDVLERVFASFCIGK
ncbi:MAG: tRNA uridine-5-carboxymethylaminomethyl(34) synthesis GTPase MnmE [Pseudomonadota bacterium]|nr:tRNA uridine-5-carboxymethylaminomethyl(34) synthesis GTPase MnmE [Pseudomonadota bacterium]